MLHLQILQRESPFMLVKIIGGALLLVGAVLAVKMLLSVLWAVFTVVATAAILYGGWRLLNR